ncbi:MULTISPECIES: LacI family DNA-binding transcriptional regulator [Streptomyces violaceusniger group]|uniref:LacI family DNA-binding transcriptional regulator n=1 Tax=Streptomyces violaceusniger group TaxID=2839105 RepID=UPI00355845E7
MALRAINNAPHVSRAKREAVERAVRQLGWVPNRDLRASGHRGGRARYRGYRDAMLAGGLDPSRRRRGTSPSPAEPPPWPHCWRTP